MLPEPIASTRNGSRDHVESQIERHQQRTKHHENPIQRNRGNRLCGRACSCKPQFECKIFFRSEGAFRFTERCAGPCVQRRHDRALLRGALQMGAGKRLVFMLPGVTFFHSCHFNIQVAENRTYVPDRGEGDLSATWTSKTQGPCRFCTSAARFNEE